MVGKIIAIVLCAVAASACPSPYGPCCGEKVYPIVLPHCGPPPSIPPPVNAPPIYAPAQEGPLIPLPSPPIPAPQVISHKCVCTKTIVKPQVIQRVINVPKVTRYLKRTYKPVVENIQYTTVPQCADNFGPCGPCSGPFPPCSGPFPPCSGPYPPCSGPYPPCSGPYPPCGPIPLPPISSIC